MAERSFEVMYSPVHAFAIQKEGKIQEVLDSWNKNRAIKLISTFTLDDCLVLRVPPKETK